MVTVSSFKDAAVKEPLEEEMLERSIFTYAKHNEFTKINALVTENEFDVNERDDYGRTALHICATFDSLESACELLMHPGIKIEIPDYESGWTPLHRALYFKHYRVAFALLRCGANLGDALSGDWRSLVAPKRDYNRSVRNWSRWTPTIDHEGSTPLDLLSCSLAGELRAARQTLRCTSVLTFGKADYVLGVPLPNSSEELHRPRRVDTLETGALPAGAEGESVVALVAGKHHSLAVTSAGRCFSWGHGRGGRLGHGDEQAQPEPALLGSLLHCRVTLLATSDNHTLAVTDTGRVYSWGSNRFGQLGLGNGATGTAVDRAGGVSSSGFSATPRMVHALHKVVVAGIAAGDTHSLCFTTAGEVYAWGCNKNGQLGLKPSDTSSMPGGAPGCSLPKRVTALGAILGSGGTSNPVLQLSAAQSCTLLLCRPREGRVGMPANEVYQWGHGNCQPVRVHFSECSAGCSCKGKCDGRCGGGLRFISRGPVQVTQIAAGRFHNVALSAAGLVYTWGLGTAEQLGHWSEAPVTHSQPQLVEALLPESGGCKAIQVCVSSGKTCVVSESGDLYTWGAAEAQGSLGHGSGKYQPRPKRVVGVKRAAAVACGEDHTLVLQSASLPTLPFPELNNSASAEAVQTAAEGAEDESDSDSEVGNLDLFGLSDIEAETCAASPATPPPVVPSLKDMCQRKLAEQVNLRTVLGVLSAAHTLSCGPLVVFCAAFVQWNMDAVLVEASPSDADLLLQSLPLQSLPLHRRYELTVQQAHARRKMSMEAEAAALRERDRGHARSGSGSFEERVSTGRERSGSGSMRRSGSMGDTAAGLPARERTPSKELDSAASVSRLIRAVRKRLAAIEEIEQRLGVAGEETEGCAKLQSPAVLSDEQREKLGRKIGLRAELKRLLLIHARLEGEERVVAMAINMRGMNSTEDHQHIADKVSVPELHINTVGGSSNSSSVNQSSSRAREQTTVSQSPQKVAIVQPPQFAQWAALFASPAAASEANTRIDSPSSRPVPSTIEAKALGAGDSTTRTPLSLVGRGGRTVLSPPPLPLNPASSVASSNTLPYKPSALVTTPITPSITTPSKLYALKASPPASSSPGSANSNGKKWKEEVSHRTPVTATLASFIVGSSAPQRQNAFESGKIAKPRDSGTASQHPTSGSNSGGSNQNVWGKTSDKNEKSSGSSDRGSAVGLLELQREAEETHLDLFVRGNCVVDKYESKWSVGVTRGAAASLRDVMLAAEREEQMLRDQELANQLKKLEKQRHQQLRHKKKKPPQTKA